MDTPVFDQSTMKFDKPEPCSVQSLTEIIKDKVYHIINNFTELTKGESFADWEQFKQVMLTYTKSDTDIA